MQYQSCQGAHPVRDAIAGVYGLDQADVRVVCPDVGGSFGAKAGATPELLVLGELSRRVGRPVRWFETRTENMVAMGHGRAQRQVATLGGTRGGRITGYKLEVVQDSGAYPAMGAVLPFMTRMMTTGVYEMGDVEFSAASVVTTTTPLVAYRGAGRPEAAAALERMVDIYATEIGLDPAEVRRINLLPPDVFPFTTPTGTEYDSGDYAKALDLVLETAGYAELRAEQAERRAAGDRRLLGIGMAVYVEVTGGGAEYGEVQLRPDGSILVKTGSNPYGQGHHTAWAMLVSDRLGIPMDRIEVVHGDTDVIPPGRGHRRVTIGAAGRGGGARRRRQAPRAGSRASRRPARGGARRRRARRGRGPLPRGRHAVHRARVGGARRRGRRPVERAVRSGRLQGHLPVRRPPGRRRGRPGHGRGRAACAWWRSTTPA